MSSRCRRRPAPTGLVGWLRANLFSSPFNIVLTVLTLAFIVWVGRGRSSTSSSVDAVWTGSDRDGLHGQRAAPQSRRLLALRVGAAAIISSTAPIRSPQRWRVDVFFAMLAFGVVWMLWLDAPRRDLGAGYFFVVVPIVLVRAAAWRAHCRTALGRHLVVGRHPGDRRGRRAVGIVVSLPLGILLALGRRSQHAGGAAVLP